jgi:hypothetical protein
VQGSRGGYGWPQWTGPRRRAYEAYCQRNRLDPASDKANYGFLLIELKGNGRKAVSAVQAATGLRNKVIAFETAFLRSGVKHYGSRMIWAERAVQAYREAEPGLRQPDDPGPGPILIGRPATRPGNATLALASLLAVLGAAALKFWGIV